MNARRGARRVTAAEPTVVGGRYRLEQALGRGGMATVWRGVDTQLGREIAVKLMRPELGDDEVFRSRFVNEARNAASISHPNVVTVFDFGADGGAPYIVMELVEGGDLAKLIAGKAPLSPRRAASIAAQVAAALQAAHAHGIVHRDMKPGNVLIAADGHPCVADFGIARATGEQSLTGTGTSLGSVDYFSPEQARGEPATAASDVYALGVVLYEMLTGRRPFGGDSPYAVAVARIEAPPPDPRLLRRAIPKALASIVQRAMAREPIDRFASAADMELALQAWLSRKGDAAAAVAAPVTAPAAASVATSDATTQPVPRSPRRAAPRRKAAVAAASVLVPTPAPLADAAPVVPASTAPPAPAAGVPIASAAEVRDDEERRRFAPPFLAGAAVVLLAVLGFWGGRALSGGGAGDEPTGGVLVGEPWGEVLASTPEPRATARPTAAATPSPEPTIEPTQAPTPAPVVAAATPAPPPPPPAATPAPTPIAVAMAITPDQTVATWYSYVENGEFDAAYSLWSERMKRGFPRQGNLDNRWRDTADISILQLYIAERTATTASVQIEFIETKENGSSRRFFGWWELVRSGDAWLLDQPHF